MKARARSRYCVGRALVPLVLVLLFAADAAGAEFHVLDNNNSPDSYFLVATDTAGLIGFIGHRHAILAAEWQAELSLDRDNLASSAIRFTAQTNTLVLDSEQAYRLAGFTRPVPPEADRLATLERIVGPDVLNVTQNPVIRFTSTALQVVTTRSAARAAAGDADDAVGADRLAREAADSETATMELAGMLQLRGDYLPPAPVTVLMTMETGPERTVFTGSTTIRQSEFGIKPFSVAGLMRVRDEIRLVWHLEIAGGQP